MPGSRVAGSVGSREMEVEHGGMARPVRAVRRGSETAAIRWHHDSGCTARSALRTARSALGTARLPLPAIGHALGAWPGTYLPSHQLMTSKQIRLSAAGRRQEVMSNSAGSFESCE